MKRKTKRNLKKNPYIVDYGYHLTSHRNLKSILTNGFKRSLYKQKSNYERWLLNNLIYGGRSPIYFFTNSDPFKSMSPELEYSLKESEANILLKVDIRSFDQLPDIPHLLDEGSFLLEIPDDINKSYLKLDYWESDKTQRIFTKYLNLLNYTIPIEKFKTNENLMIDTIFFTETLCVADEISPKYIKEIIDL